MEAEREAMLGETAELRQGLEERNALQARLQEYEEMIAGTVAMPRLLPCMPMAVEVSAGSDHARWGCGRRLREPVRLQRVPRPGAAASDGGRGCGSEPEAPHVVCMCQVEAERSRMVEELEEVRAKGHLALTRSYMPISLPVWTTMGA